MGRILLRSAARQDVLIQMDYLTANAGPETALRFFASFRQTLQKLARMPEMAQLCRFKQRSLVGVRRWPVAGFEDWLIFFRATGSGVDVLRILHGARDLEDLLEPNDRE